MNASKHDRNDAGVAAASEAAAPSEAATQVASDSAPASESDSASGSGSSRKEELEGVAAAPAETESNHQHPVELDLEELRARAERADEYLDLAQRAQADFENYRKRTARDAANAQRRGISKLARELLPALDNLERALAAADSTSAGELASGIKLVYDEVLAALARAGIEPFSPEGEQFDPQHHDAVAQQPSPEAEPGTVLEVYQRGYRLGDAVLRPARVSVAG